VSAALLAQHAAAQVTLYEHDNLHGRVFTTDRQVNDLERYGFNDRASSVIIQGGQWELCEHANFEGRCVTLRRGQYASLGAMGMNDKVSSLRRVSATPTPVYAPPPVSAPPPAPPPYAYYPHHGETLYQANVVAVRAVLGPPEQRCWVEQQQVQSSGANIPGAIIGGVLGGVLGHQIGNGRGNDVATAVGAVGGAAVGANVNRGTQTSTQNVQRCADVPGSAAPTYWDVTYEFRGLQHRAQLNFAPGPTITVNGRGEPRA
jgi:uncharacterized protein YcfJ